MSGYTRQSAADIVPTAIVRSAPVNTEFNAIRDAFDATVGHKHDGSTGEAVYVPLIGDADARNKVAVDTANNRVGVFVEVSSAAVEQVRVQDGVIVPVTTNDIDLGTSSLEFKNLYIDGVAKIDTLTVDENATVAGTLNVTGLSTLASVDINAGTIDGAVVGAASPQAVTGTNVTATTGFSGTLTGNVTGNLTGNSAGTHTGAVIGDVTGNVTASSGSSSFNNVTINGSLDMNSGSAATVTGLSAPVNSSDAATKSYVDTSISNLVASAPGTLDTLNELAAALGNDASFSTTITNSIATKLPLAGGTMSGAIAMGTSKITGVGDPTAAQDAATKTYVDTADALKLNLSGGTMSGNIVMGASKVTSTATPTTDDDLTRKAYVDSILGSATAAATSAAAALTSETNAAGSASSASSSAASAAASYDSFDDRYLGSKASAPSVDNDGNTLLTGAIYWNSASNSLFIWTGSAWNAAAFDISGALIAVNNLSDVPNKPTALTNLGAAPSASPTFTGQASFPDGTAAAPSIAHTGDLNAGLFFPAADTVAVSTAGTERMRVDSSGNVGIGNSNPTAKLEVVTTSGTATAKIWSATNTTPIADLELQRGTNATWGADVYGDYRLRNDSGALLFQYGESTVTTERMRIDSSGNLGLGVTPSAWGSSYKVLDIGGGASFAGLGNSAYVTSNSYDNGTNYIYKATAASTLYLATSGQHRWYNAPSGTAGNAVTFTQAMTLDASGNLGIGTTSPLAKVHSQVNTFTTADMVAYKAYNNQAVGVYANFQNSATGTAITDGFLIGIGDAEDAVLQNQEATNMIFSTSATERMRIDSSGNVGIGTSSPATKLDVSGTVNATALSIGGTAITATAAELNYNDITTLGTSQASKVVTADASGDVKFANSVIETVYALSGTTPALNPTNGTIQTWTLSASSSPTDSLVAGESLTLMIDDGTAYAITWPSVTWKTGGGVAPTLNTTGFTAIQLWKISSTLYGARVGDA